MGLYWSTQRSSLSTGHRLCPPITNRPQINASIGISRKKSLKYLFGVVYLSQILTWKKKMFFELISCLLHQKFRPIGQWLWLSGRAVASNSRGPWFESSHWPTFILNIVYCQLYWKDENKRKRGREWSIKNNLDQSGRVAMPTAQTQDCGL